MKLQVFSADANPRIDCPRYYAKRRDLAKLLLKVASNQLRQLTPHSFQEVARTNEPPCEQFLRDAGYDSAAHRDTGRRWALRGLNLQLVLDAVAGKCGKFHYPVPAIGARSRLLCVAAVNGTQS